MKPQQLQVLAQNSHPKRIRSLALMNMMPMV
jgi:hypothetical protein